MLLLCEEPVRVVFGCHVGPSKKVLAGDRLPLFTSFLEVAFSETYMQDSG